MSSLFGTDGIRGVANEGLTADLALRVGRAVAVACREGTLGPVTTAPRVVLGRDTRPSGPMLESALTAGLCSGGADVLRAGILPTPAIAYLVQSLEADAGVVVSASHNPPRDNGIKVFGAGGWKLSERTEGALEDLVDTPASAPGGTIGHVVEVTDAEDRYVSHLVDSVGRSLEGIRVVLDCANGAAYRVGPRALTRAGVSVEAINATGDGELINHDCGAMHPDVVGAAARASGAIGLTLDGDADRVLAADESGRIVDGDAIIALLAGRLHAAGRLPGNAVVVTVMANQALRTWCDGAGIAIVETPVGDRHVLEVMRRRHLVLGGEQSGHVLRLDAATTGDGLLTALGLLECVADAGGRLAHTVPFTPLPQVLVNVRCVSLDGLESSEAIQRSIDAARARLGDRGRVLVRRSGTEPVVRVMVEAPTDDDAARVADEIAREVRAAMGAGA